MHIQMSHLGLVTAVVATVVATAVNFGDGSPWPKPPEVASAAVNFGDVGPWPKPPEFGDVGPWPKPPEIASAGFRA